MGLPARALLAAAFVFAALPSDAAPVQVTFYGTVTQGYDGGGTFGPADRDLAGLDMSVTYVFDTDWGQRSQTGLLDLLQGGAAYGTGPIFRSVQLVLGGVSQVMTGSYAGSVMAYADRVQGVGYLQASAVDFALGQGGGYDYGTSYSYLQAFDGSLTGRIDQPLVLTGLGASGDAFGGFGFYSYDALRNRFLTSVSASYAIDRVVLEQLNPASVPLPASALGLMAAIGMLGALRRRA